jgi:arabinofuranosyltransferase
MLFALARLRALFSSFFAQGPLAYAWLALGLATIIFQVWLWPFVTDDAYISFRYTARLCAGAGLSFNDGAAVEGFSNPLWTVFVALPCLLGGDIVLFSQITGLIFTSLMLIAVWLGARVMVPQAGLAALAVAILLLNPGVQVYASLGMEVPLLAALLSWACAFTLLALQADKPRWLYVAAGLLGLASITRPEGLLYGALWGLGLFIYWQPWRQRGHWLPLTSLAALILVPFSAYLAFRWSYYGALLPNTALAKAVPFHFRDHAGFLSVLGPLLFLLFIALGFFPWRQLLQAPVRSLVLRICVSALGIGLAGLIFTWYGRDDWMAFVRFLQPAYPVLVLLCAALFWLQLEAAAPALRRTLITTVPLLVMLCSLFALWPWLRQETVAATMMRNTEPLAVAQAVKTLFPEPRTLAAGRIGALAYVNLQHTLWDFFGLTDREQALAIYASGRSGPDFAFAIADNPIITREPELLMITRSAAKEGLSAYSADDLAFLQPRWRCVLRFKQGYFGSYDLWVRYDVKPELASACGSIVEPADWLAEHKK